MRTRAPSAGKILVAVGFALSCFALLLFLWVTFGGSVPFKPKSYRISADFSEAITLQKEADVRIGGVSVGSVSDIELPEDGNATRAVLEIDPEYAPISSDAFATLRQKTLLGESYIELTSGTQFDDRGNPIDDPETEVDETTDVSTLSGDDAAEPLPEDGHLESSQVIEQVQIDEIFNAFDEPTRKAFQEWMINSGIAANGRGLDLNDAFGNVGPFSSDASDVLATLRRQEEALKGVVRNTGTVFEALTAREQELAGAVVNSNRVFRALGSRDQELAETFQILPTFQNEARLTLDRLESFAENAGPLMRDLRPVARDISPTLRDLRRLSPNARRLFVNLNPLIKASETGLPALGRTLDRLPPVLQSLDPFLANFNPILRFTDYYAPNVNDFLGNPAAGTAGVLEAVAGQSGPRHISRQLGVFTPETLSIFPSRLRTNRGNGYIQPRGRFNPLNGYIGNPASVRQAELFPSHDCDNTGATGGLGGGQVSLFPQSTPPPQPGLLTPLALLPSPPLPVTADPDPVNGPDTGTPFAACTVAPPYPEIFGGLNVPIVDADPPYNSLP